jgi:hypothetical protein
MLTGFAVRWVALKNEGLGFSIARIRVDEVEIVRALAVHDLHVHAGRRWLFLSLHVRADVLAGKRGR